MSALEELASLLRNFQDNPTNLAFGVLRDWLDDRSDPRGQVLHDAHVAEYEPPVWCIVWWKAINAPMVAVSCPTIAEAREELMRLVLGLFTVRCRRCLLRDEWRTRYLGSQPVLNSDEPPWKELYAACADCHGRRWQMAETLNPKTR